MEAWHSDAHWPTAITHHKFDIRTADADVLEQAIIEGHQRTDIAADPAFATNRENARLIAPARVVVQGSALSPFRAALNSEGDASSKARSRSKRAQAHRHGAWCRLSVRCRRRMAIDGLDRHPLAGLQQRFEIAKHPWPSAMAL